MEFIKTLWENKTIAWKLGKSDFKNRFANTSLGSVWGFLQPFVFMMMYVVVFQFIFGMEGDGGSPYIVWYLPGMAIWQCLNDSIMSASSAIRNYSYLVKKVVFPIDIIPIISLIGSSFVSIFLIIVATVVCSMFGYVPNILQAIYVVIAVMGVNIITENHGIYTIVFWIITVIMYVWGNNVFKKNKKDFADVL